MYCLCVASQNLPCKGAFCQMIYSLKLRKFPAHEKGTAAIWFEIFCKLLVPPGSQCVHPPFHISGSLRDMLAFSILQKGCGSYTFCMQTYDVAADRAWKCPTKHWICQGSSVALFLIQSDSIDNGVQLCAHEYVWGWTLWAVGRRWTRGRLCPDHSLCHV